MGAGAMEGERALPRGTVAYLEITAGLDWLQPHWNPIRRAGACMPSIHPIVGNSLSVVHSCGPQHSMEKPMLATPIPTTSAHVEGTPLELPVELVSEIEHCYAEGVRRGDWPPCSLSQFMLALMHAGSRDEG